MYQYVVKTQTTKQIELITSYEWNYFPQAKVQWIQISA